MEIYKVLAMDEYIKREDIYQGYFRMTPLEIPNVGVVYPQTRVEEMIGELPATDVAPVRHGHWIIPTKISGRAFDIPHCSACDGVPCGADKNTNFCPNCGAKMDLEVES